MQMPERGRQENGTQRTRGQENQNRQYKPRKSVNQDALVEAGQELGLDAQQVNQVTQGERHDQKARQNRTERRSQE